tara:strand:+ start:5109 stop:5603 length:495 start_codon:yes stop_codon:yes gene_type:complete
MKLLKFIDGKKIYEDLETEYKRHSKGYVILGPPGIGKTTFVNSQKGIIKDWIDTDVLFGKENLNVNWQNNNPIDNRLSYLRADYMLEQSKLYGFRIIGALFWRYKADCMIIPPIDKHELFLKSRKDLDFKKIIKMRDIFKKHATDNNIPIFENIENSIKYIENL